MTKMKSTTIAIEQYKIVLLLEEVDAYLDSPEMYSRMGARSALKRILEKLDPEYVNDNMRAVHDHDTY